MNPYLFSDVHSKQLNLAIATRILNDITYTATDLNLTAQVLNRVKPINCPEDILLALCLDPRALILNLLARYHPTYAYNDVNAVGTTAIRLALSLTVEEYWSVVDLAQGKPSTEWSIYISAGLEHLITSHQYSRRLESALDNY